MKASRLNIVSPTQVQPTGLDFPHFARSTPASLPEASRSGAETDLSAAPRLFLESRSVQDFSHIPVQPRTAGVIQTKLAVNRPGDLYEQEANQVAARVTAAQPNPEIRNVPPRIQRFAGQPAGQVEVAPASVDQALASPGKPLEPALRQGMEQRFGHDFSHVRVHTGAAAEQSVRDVNALAYTVGHDIAFGAGQFMPGTPGGQQLIAHELTHVVQQTGFDGRPTANRYVARKGPSPFTARPTPARQPVPLNRPVRRPGQYLRHGQPVRPQQTPRRQHGRPGRGQTEPGSQQDIVVDPYTGLPKPLYPIFRQPGAVLAPEDLDLLPVGPRRRIAIATFSPKGAVLQNVEWGGEWGGKFNQDGKTRLDMDPDMLTFAILEPPTSILMSMEGQGRVTDIGTSTGITWDGYQVPVISDLDAALVLPHDSVTEATFRLYGESLDVGEAEVGLREFRAGVYWVPLEHIKIVQPLTKEVALTPARARENEEKKFMEQVAEKMKTSPFRTQFGQTGASQTETEQAGLEWDTGKKTWKQTSNADVNVLKFAGTGEKVTINRLIAWAERTFPRGVDEAVVLKAVSGSHDFIGSPDARAEAAAWLALELRARKQAAVAPATQVEASTKTGGRRRRRRCSRSVGPTCPTWQPRLTARHDYWDIAYKYRERQRLLEPQHFNRNVAVLVLDGSPPIIQENDMHFHSEQLVYWALQRKGADAGCPILGLFSERKPCQEICQKDILPGLCRLNEGVPYNVYFATDYYNSPHGQKSENNRHAVLMSYVQAGYFKGF